MGDSHLQSQVVYSYGFSHRDHQQILETLDRDLNPVEMEIVARTMRSTSVRSLFNLMSKSVSRLPVEQEVITVGEDIHLILRAASLGCQSPDHARSVAVACTSSAVGGVVASGGRPLLIAHSRLVGSPEKRGMKKLVQGLASGAQSYGERVGIPAQTSEVVFEEGYDGNPVFIAVAVGLLRGGSRVKPEASGAGNPVFLLEPDSVSGDDLLDFERARIEVCQELSRRSYLVGMESVSSQGLAETCARMALNGKSGLTLNLAALIGREKGVTAPDVMFSGSLGRVVAVIAEGFEKELRGICRKAGLRCSLIGRVGDDHLFTIRRGSTQVATLPLEIFTSRDQTVSPGPPPVKPARFDSRTRLNVARISSRKSWSDIMVELFRSPNVLVQTLLSANLSSKDAGVGLMENRAQGRILVDIKSSGRFTHLDPLTGGTSAVLTAARTMVCRGGVPSGALLGLMMRKDTTQPEDIYLNDVATGLAQGFGGMNLPVANFLLQTDCDHGYTTPVVAVVGFVEASRKIVSAEFKDPDDFVLLLGSHRGELGASEYLNQLQGKLEGPPPVSDVAVEGRIHDILLVAARVGLVKSAIPVSRGGLAVALMQGLVGAAKGTGVRIHMSSKLRSEELLFGETQGLMIVTIHENSLIEIERLCMRFGIPCTAIGRVTDEGEFVFDGLIRLEVEKVRKLLTPSLKKLVWGQ